MGAAAAASDLELYQRLNNELASMVGHFANLVRATKEGLDADDAREPGGARGRVPGELLEVLVEKLLAAGHQCVHTVSRLKRGALVGDADALIAATQAAAVALQRDAYHAQRGLEQVRRDAEALLADLERHYYASTHRGPPPPPQHQQQQQQGRGSSGGGGGSGSAGGGGGGGGGGGSAGAAGAGAGAPPTSLAELCAQVLELTGGA